MRRSNRRSTRRGPHRASPRWTTASPSASKAVEYATRGKGVARPWRESQFDDGLATAELARIAKEKAMAMSPWEPFADFTSLRDAMSHLFDESVIAPRGMGGMQLLSRAIPVDVREMEN